MFSNETVEVFSASLLLQYRISKLNNKSVMDEFKEWDKDAIPETKSIWTLPDLTSYERLNNFCRSIKKEIK